MLDHGTHVFVWLGGDAASAKDAPAVREACARFAAGLTAGRTPLPELRTVVEVRAACMHVSYSHAKMKRMLA